MKYLGKERPCKECDDTKKPDSNTDCPNAWFYRKCILEMIKNLEWYSKIECGNCGKCTKCEWTKQARISIGVKK